MLKKSAYTLHIGSLPDGIPLTYSGDGSIVTIAPPGSGKTLCNVFPNLLTWKRPAVVLDISGDIYEHTGAWRSSNLCAVYKFSPWSQMRATTTTPSRSSGTIPISSGRTQSGGAAPRLRHAPGHAGAIPGGPLARPVRARHPCRPWRYLI